MAGDRLHERDLALRDCLAVAADIGGRNRALVAAGSVIAFVAILWRALQRQHGWHKCFADKGADLSPRLLGLLNQRLVADDHIAVGIAALVAMRQASGVEPARGGPAGAHLTLWPERKRGLVAVARVADQ